MVIMASDWLIMVIMASDWFSSCSVHGKLFRPLDSPEENMVTYNGMTLDKNTLPGDYDSVRNVLSGFALDVNGKSGKVDWK